MHAPCTTAAAGISQLHSQIQLCPTLRHKSKTSALSSVQGRPRSNSSVSSSYLVSHASVRHRTGPARRPPPPCWPSRGAVNAPPSAAVAEASTNNLSEGATDHSNSATATHHATIEQQPLLLPQYDPNSNTHLDLVVAGGGPAGLAVAVRVSAAGYKVCVIEPAPLAAWPNNYGVWVDEFEAMGLEDCLEVVWPRARVFLNNTEDGRKSLSRPYGRVDRVKLKRKLLESCIEQGVSFHETRVSSVTHGGGASSVACADGSHVAGTLVLDATGHARKLVEFDAEFNPGYQGAYGIMAEVESHPFDLDTMLFMDWRDDHTVADPAMREANAELPTFLYAMPFSKTRVFLEETSLVARPALPFPELKARLERRMAHMGIKVISLEEEEYCLIPMGGVLPSIPQRVLGIGGTAGMVHPSTGYMVARALGAAPTIADSIIDQLASPTDKARDAGGAAEPLDEAAVDAISSAVWRMTWPKQRLRQREFFTFGMEVLLKLDLKETREFFAAFFSLSTFHWQGFLSARLTFWELIGFGLSLFKNASNPARADLLVKGLPGLIVMLVRLTRIR